MTIYMPQRNLFNSQVWGQMMPKILGSMAMAKYEKGLQEPPVVPGEEFYWQKKDGKLVKTETPVPRRGGASANIQRKTRTFVGKDGKVYAQEFNFDPTTGGSAPYGKPFQSKTVSPETKSKQNQVKVAKQQAGLRQINSILKRAGIKEIDIVTFAGLSAEEQKKYMELQTKPLIDRVPRQYRNQLRQYYKKVHDITLDILGPLPEIERTGVDATGRKVIKYKDGSIEYAD